MIMKRRPQLSIGVAPATPRQWHRLFWLACRKQAQRPPCTPPQVTPALFDDLTGVAFGCPAMGAEVLEEMDFQPMWDEAKGFLGGKNVALFGSYGWGDGEWMRSWEADCEEAMVNLVCESVICMAAPDDTAIEACKALGKTVSLNF